MNYELVYKKPEAFYFDEQAGVYTKCLINGVKFCDAVPLRDPLEHCEKFFYLKEKDDYQYIIYTGRQGHYMLVHQIKRKNFAMRIFSEETLRL